MFVQFLLYTTMHTGIKWYYIHICCGMNLKTTTIFLKILEKQIINKLKKKHLWLETQHIWGFNLFQCNSLSPTPDVEMAMEREQQCGDITEPSNEPEETAASAIIDKQNNTIAIVMTSDD
jgi:hypothetical protein